MRLRSVELANLRRFAGQRATLDGIGDGIAVLSEPNEFGKSTFLDALQALFFEKHRRNSDLTRSLRPHAGGAPEAAARIELPQGQFRIEKRWLARPTARILDAAGRLVAQDDEAEAWIDALLGGGLAGPSGLLWVRQGVTGLDPEGGGTARADREAAQAVRRDLLSSVAGEIESMTGGRRMDALRDRANEAFARLATATGKPKAGGDWARAAEEAAVLAAEEADLAKRKAALSGDLKRRAEAQRSLASLSDPAEAAARAESLRAAEAAHKAAQDHADRVARAADAERIAAQAEAAARQDLGRIEALAQAAEAAEGAAARAAEQAAAAQDGARDLAARADTATQAAERAEATADDLRRRFTAAQRAQIARAAAEAARALAQRLERAQDLAAALEPARAAHKVLAIPPRPLAAAEAAQAEVDRLAALAAAQAVTVQALPAAGARASIAGRPLGDGPHPLTAPVTIDLPGFGALRVDPGPGRDDQAARAAADALARALAACGTDTLSDARKRQAEAADLAFRIGQDEARLAGIAPEGLEALRRATAEAQARAAPVEAAEDPAALEAPLEQAETAARAARGEAQAAQRLANDAVTAAAVADGARATAQRAAQDARAAAGDAVALAARIADAQASLPGLMGATEQARQTLVALRAAAPDLATAEAALARARSAQQSAQDEDRRLRDALIGLNATIAMLADEGIEERFDEVTGKRAAAEARAARYEAEVRALARLRRALEDARGRAREAYLAPVMAELQPLLSILHPDAALAIDDATLLPAALTRAGQAEPLDILSGGTREQLAILTRLAFARLFARSGRPVPVILDDALVHSDDDRIEAMFTALHRVARDQQILVFTCRQRAFAALGGARLHVTVTAI